MLNASTTRTNMPSDKQDKMIDMMTNQEKTLESMFQAQDSLRRYLRNAENPLEHDGDTASIFTSTTHATALTAFDFDSVIKATAVYQRCMRRRGNDNGLLALGSSVIHMTYSSDIRGAVMEAERDSAYGTSVGETAAEEDVKWQEFCEAGFSEHSTRNSITSDDVRTWSPGSSPSDLSASTVRWGDAATNHRRMPPTRLSDKATSPHGRTVRLSHIHERLETHAKFSDSMNKGVVHNQARNANYERIKQKLIGKLIQRQRETPVEYELETREHKDRNRRSSSPTRGDTLASVPGPSRLTLGGTPDSIPHGPTSISDIDIDNPFLAAEDTTSSPDLPQIDVSEKDQRHFSQDTHTDHEREQCLSVSSTSSSILNEPSFVDDRYDREPSEVSLNVEFEKHDSATLSADSYPIDAIVCRTSVSDDSIPKLSDLPVIAQIRGPRCEEIEKRRVQTNPRLLYDHQEEVTNLAISSKLILAASSANLIRLWDLSTGKEVVRIPCDSYSQANSCLVFSSDGTSLAAARLVPKETTSTVIVWDAKTGARRRALKVDNVFGNTAIAISENNRLIACGQEDKRHLRRSNSTVMLYEIATGRRIGKLPPLETPARLLSFIQEDRHLLCCSKGKAQIWNVATYTLVQVWEYPGHTFYRSILTHDLMLVTSNGLNRADMYDLRSGVKKATMILSDSIRRLACAPGTSEIAFAGCNGLVGTWNPWTGTVRRSSTNHETHLYGVAISPDGRAMFYGGTDGLVNLRYIDDRDHVGSYSDEQSD